MAYEPHPNLGSEPYEFGSINPTNGDCVCWDCNELCIDCRCAYLDEKRDIEETHAKIDRRRMGGLS